MRPGSEFGPRKSGGLPWSSLSKRFVEGRIMRVSKLMGGTLFGFSWLLIPAGCGSGGMASNGGGGGTGPMASNVYINQDIVLVLVVIS